MLDRALVGRSHRSAPAKVRLREVIDRSRALLNLPADHRLGIVPASDTGAFEMAMWNLLGPRGVDLIAFESFGHGWVTDVVRELRLGDVRTLSAEYGALPDLDLVAPERDVVFTWNGTTSGVRVPDAAWIADDRSGLTLSDATSAIFAMSLEWSKLDVATYSWQKVLGGEAQHGVIILGPRAVERIESFRPERPLPKIFRLAKGGKLIEGIFQGETINTPSMLAVEDALDGLRWAEAEGGLDALIRRADANLSAVAEWVARSDWIGFLAHRPAIRSSTSMCLKIVDPRVQALPEPAQRAFIKQFVQRLEQEEVAFDIAAYRDAPPGLRLWGGATVETADLEALFPWLDWAFGAGLSDL